MAIGTMALVAILSVFNGFDDLIRSMFNSFDPDIKITAVHGKSFSPDNEKIRQIIKLPGIAYYADVIEENALLRNKDKQYLAKVKGVSDHFIQICDLSQKMIRGSFVLNDKNGNYAVLGAGVAYYLSAVPGMIEPMNIYTPKRNMSASDLENAFNIKQIYPSGVFEVQKEFDDKYILVSIGFARELFDYPNQITSLELKLQKGMDKNKIQEEIIRTLGSDYNVKNRFQQNELLFKIMQSEKFSIFVILSFILLIASFNILGSLTMLIIDKKNDIGILQSLGADKTTIRNIFLFEGWAISIVGAILGLVLGFLLCLIQQKFGILKLNSNGGSFIIDSYPVKMQLLDFIYVFITVVTMGFLAAWYPVRFMAKKYLNIR
jgi:ABC-type lipoprotein release transport system permease subunit